MGSLQINQLINQPKIKGLHLRSVWNLARSVESHDPADASTAQSKQGHGAAVSGRAPCSLQMSRSLGRARTTHSRVFRRSTAWSWCQHVDERARSSTGELAHVHSSPRTAHPRSRSPDHVTRVPGQLRTCASCRTRPSARAFLAPVAHDAAHSDAAHKPINIQPHLSVSASPSSPLAAHSLPRLEL